MELTHDEVWEQLQRMLSHDDFADAPRRSRLLKYLVEKTLSGQQNQIKGYAIGIDVFDRPDDFDPQIDSIVRVQAGRLRKTLKLYYLTSGQDDPVHIELPKGRYIPKFTYQSASSANKKSEPVVPSVVEEIIPHIEEPDDKLTTPSNIKKLILPVLLLSGLVAIFLFSTLRIQNSTTSVFKKAAALPTGPSITVLPFETLPYTGEQDGQVNARSIKAGLQHELIEKISRFRDLKVVTQMTPDANALGNLSTDYALTGSIQTTDNIIRISSALAMKETGEILWSKTYNETLENTGSLLSIQTAITSDVASALGQPYSAVNKSFAKDLEEAQKHGLDQYYCLMKFYQYSARKTELSHKIVRDCLEKTVKEDPDYSSAWAALSWIYGDELRNGFNLKEGADSPNIRALSAAEKATELDGENAMAFQYLAIAYFTLEYDDDFKVAAKRALELNPNDPEVLADIGSHLIQLGNSETAPQMVEKALLLNPNHPPWYHGSLTMHYYMQGTTKEALSHAQQYSRDGSLASQVLLVACLIQYGQLETAKESYQALISNYPQFKTNYESLIKSWRLPEGMDKKILEDLRIAGLETS